MKFHGFTILLAIAALALIGCSPFLPRTVGMPMGKSVRTANYIATLIVTEEPRIPSLHHRPEDDRYRVELLLHPTSGGPPRSRVPILSSKRHSDFRSSPGLLGDDGRLLWFLLDEIAAYDLQRHKLITVDDLRRANPALGNVWPASRYDLGTRMLVSSHDYQRSYAIDPATLRATPVSDTRDARRTSIFDTAPNYLSKLPSDKFVDAAAVLATPNGKPFRFSNPDGFLITYRTQRGFDGTIVVARVDATGTPLWTANTGIADLDQILPDASTPTFIGRKPRIPDKVQEPVLAIINAQSGAISSHSLRK